MVYHHLRSRSLCVVVAYRTRSAVEESRSLGQRLTFYGCGEHHHANALYRGGEGLESANHPLRTNVPGDDVSGPRSFVGGIPGRPPRHQASRLSKRSAGTIRRLVRQVRKITTAYSITLKNHCHNIPDITSLHPATILYITLGYTATVAIVSSSCQNLYPWPLNRYFVTRSR